jgi:ATP-binding cassette subfamily B protein
MGFFAGLNDEKYDRQYSDRQLYTRIAAYFRPQRQRIGLVTALVIMIALIGAALPVAVARALDLLEAGPSAAGIGMVGGLLLVIGGASWGLNWARRSLVVRAVGDVVLDLRRSAFRAAAEHDLSFYDQFSSGRIVWITSDTNDFGQLVVIVTDVAAQLLQAVVLGTSSFRQIGGWRCWCWPSCRLFAVAAWFRAMARRVTQRMQAMADVSATIKETISGIAVAKNFRQEASIFASFDVSNQMSYRVNVRRGFVLSLVFPTLNALGGIFVGIWSTPAASARRQVC